MPRYSLVVPVYRNELNIIPLLKAVEDIAAKLAGDFEAIFVVDGSPDNSGKVLLDESPNYNFSSKIVFHSRNFGAFAAIRTGLECSSGTYVAAMAADLQEPPSLILEAFFILNADRADIVFGERVERDDKFLSKLLSKIFWAVYRRYVLPAMPRGGVDIFACNKMVKDAVLTIEEPNSSLIAQLFWVGYRRTFVPYKRRARQIGESAWSFSRRFRYMMDSIFSFSDLPIMLVLWVGVLGCATSFIFGLVTLIARLTGRIDEAGYTSLFLLITFFGSLVLLVQGVLGCYIWRTAENSKKRPLSLVSHVVTSASTKAESQL
jgi:polyisoprenyl-phosphate glycosyltransferase